MQQNPYTKTEWRDHIIDVETGQVIQEGTRFTASRANNIEEGIYNAYEWLLNFQTEIQKLRVQLEMTSRAPVNNGTFFDTLDGENTKQLEFLSSVAVSQTALQSGETTISLDTNLFQAGQYVTIYDDVNQETVKVTAMNGNDITVEALQNNYKKGAKVARSNTKIDDAQQRMTFGEWGTYSVSVAEVI